MKLGDRVRKAIREDDRSLRAISREIELDVAVLSRFMHEQTGLALPTLERLAEALGLELVQRKGAQSKSKGKRRK